MIGKINIQGIIDNETNSLLSIISQVKSIEKQGEVEGLEVYINSPGGNVELGKDIYNYLTGLKIPVTTIAQNQCCSIATIIFLAGSVRKVYSNCEFMIHLPLLELQQQMTLNKTDIDQLQAAFEEIAIDLANYYVNATGIDKATLLNLMKNETFINSTEMVNLGFAHEIIEGQTITASNLKAIAKSNKITNIINNMAKDKNTIIKDVDSLLNKIKNLFGAKNMTLTSTDGKELFVEREEGMPQVGDVATPDGEYMMEDGNTIVVAGGVITEIRPSMNEVEDLKNQLANLTAENTDLKNKITEMESLFSETQTLINELKEVKSDFVPKAQKKPIEPHKTEPSKTDWKEQVNKIRARKESK